MTKNHQYNNVVAKKQNVEGILGKTLPAHVDAERAVLGALLLNDEYITTISEIIVPDDFYNPAHKTIYQAIVELGQKHKRVDIVTLQDELTKKDLLDTAGGIIYLVSLQEDIPSVGLIVQHATIIKEKSVLRQLISSAATIITNCYTQDQDSIDAVLDDAEKIIFNIANKRSSNSFVQLDIWLKKTFQHLSDIKSHMKGITGVPSGFQHLDQMTSGFQNSDFIVLAARPSMGKTALALGIALEAARNGFATGVFSLEMSAEQLTLRLLSAESGIGHHNIRNATISSDEWMDLTNVAAQLAEMKVFIDDTAMLNIMDLRAKARKLKAEHGLQFLVIDYLQLLHSNKKHENRHQEVSDISRSLKALAKELNIPIIALSQLSRAVDSRMDKRPMLSDLRESGAIEQDADVIMFLYRDAVYNPEAENPALAELIIGKQRNGPTGTVYMNFIREITKFEDTTDFD
ncbi:MAG TPA: replicative DNA helicase [Candidatus Babeliales bacterium]|jgi:replicative DNA helicase|nr:replicative DNA helicase [Candidatus Babeliales bacterium]